MSTKMENFQIVHYFCSLWSWKVARLVIRRKRPRLYQKESAKNTFWGLDHDETHWFLTPNQWFFRKFQNFPGRRGEMGIVGTPSVGVWPKSWAFQIPGRSWKFEQKILCEHGEIEKEPFVFFCKKIPHIDIVRNSCLKIVMLFT